MSGYDPPYPYPGSDPHRPAPHYDAPDSSTHHHAAYDPYDHDRRTQEYPYNPHASHLAPPTHDPFNPPPPPPPAPPAQGDPYADPPWAQPVYHHHPSDLGDPYDHYSQDHHRPNDGQAAYDPHLHDSSTYSHPNPHGADPFSSTHAIPAMPTPLSISSTTSNPLLHHHQNPAPQDPTDDEPDSVPLLSPTSAAHHHSHQQHNRWSTTTTSGPLPGQADPSITLPGGFDPTLLGQGRQSPYGPVGGDDDNIVTYGRIPQRQPRRYKTVKRVQLYNGNLVLDCQVPPKLLERVPRKDDREFTHMRYTAVTCDPDEFLNERYSLRQILYETPRRTELFIVLTMYNEDEVLFCRTMHGVMKNIQHLCERNRSKTWGADGWKKGSSFTSP
ncbi:hypothetical protein JCM10212_005019 [Sporobolomyces blumeae]